MTKRILALLLAVLLGISCFALTACGGEEKTEEKPEETKTPAGDEQPGGETVVPGGETVVPGGDETVVPGGDVPAAPTLTLFDTETTVVIGEVTYDLALNLFASGQDTITYASADAAVAKVSDAGLVEGVAEGTTTITVTAKNAGGETTATLTVAVEKPFEPTDPTDVAIFAIMKDASIPQLQTWGWYSVNCVGTDFNYDNLETATPGPVEVWGGHLQYLFTLDSNEVDASVGYDAPETYDFYFDLYFKPYDEATLLKGGYKKATIQAWSVYKFAQPGNIIYRCHFYDAMYSELEEGVEYVVKGVVRQGDTVLGWADANFTWTDSCESFTHYAENNPDIIK